MKARIHTLIIIAVMLVALFYIGALFTADKTKYHNDFARILPPRAAKEFGVIELTGRISLAGLDNVNFYVRYGDSIAAISYDMLDTCNVPVKNPNSYEVSIDSPYFTIQNGMASFLQHGYIAGWDLDTSILKLPSYTAAQQISDNAAILQVIDLDLRKNIFIKTNRPGLRADILKKQVDGIFCTDGFLLFSRKENTLVYLYRYRNEVICMDTNLNVRRRFRTIDTTTVAKIKVAETGGKIVMSKPPFVVNKGAWVDGENLFVQSNLAARNESAADFNHSTVLDVYNIKDGAYKFSFYIPNRDNRKLESFKVKDTILIAKFAHWVVRYDLTREYLKR